MKAYVTSIGEVTTDLCVWALQRNGFEVEVIHNPGLLVDKLKAIYEMADQDFIRVDADTVVNKDFTPDFVLNAMDNFPYRWWLQFMTFGWHRQNMIHGGVQFIKKEALPALRASVDAVHDQDRPETMLTRIPAMYNPRRFDSLEDVCVGLHGFAAADVDRVISQKKKRDYFNDYDFELAAKLEDLLR